MLSKLQSTYFIEQETWFVHLCAHYAHTLQYTDAEDFHQETRLLMWRLHDRLDSLPLREHQPFVTCCLKHLFLKFR